MWSGRRSQIQRLRAELAELRDEVAFLREASNAPAAAELLRDGHPRASVGDDCQIDVSVRIMASDAAPVTIGERTKIYRTGEILGPVSIGKRCFINRDVYLRPGTVIGDDVAIGPFVRMVSDTHEIGGPSKRAGRVQHLPIAIGDGVWIGAGATILAGVTVGDGALVAAGAVVARDVPAHVMVGGVPARFLRDLA